MVATFTLLPLSACATAAVYPGGLTSDDPAVCIRAIKVAGDRRDRAVLPLLVRQLENEDEAVRFYAILALEKTTGTRLGYDYAKPAAERARAVKRWQNYVRSAPEPMSQPVGIPTTEQAKDP